MVVTVTVNGAVVAPLPNITVAGKAAQDANDGAPLQLKVTPPLNGFGEVAVNCKL